MARAPLRATSHSAARIQLSPEEVLQELASRRGDSKLNSVTILTYVDYAE